MVLATRSALVADGELLSSAERDEIEALIVQTDANAAGNDHAAIDAAVERLAIGTEAFAAARMNRGIRAALAGRKVEDV
jgi:molecular chaperone HscA